MAHAESDTFNRPILNHRFFRRFGRLKDTSWQHNDTNSQQFVYIIHFIQLKRNVVLNVSYVSSRSRHHTSHLQPCCGRTDRRGTDGHRAMSVRDRTAARCWSQVTARSTLLITP